MTDIIDDKPKKLTLDKGKLLSLNKNIEHTTTRRSTLSTKSNTVVEVKKSKSTVFFPQNKTNETPSIVSDNDDLKQRLNLLKRAADDTKNRATDPRFSTLSELAAINRSKSEIVVEDSVETPENLDIDVPNDEKLYESPEVVTDIVAENETFTKPSPKVQDLFDETDVASSEHKKANDTKALVPKAKVEEPKKLKKADIFFLLDKGEEDGLTKTRSLASIRRAKEKEKRKLEQHKPEKLYREVTFSETITVSDLANRMSERVQDVIRELMKLGIIAMATQTIEADTAELVVLALGHIPKRVQESDIENILIQEADLAEDLTMRAPVVTVMGHVDHGKTSLLDALKSSDVAGGEVGGITQHIGAYRVTLPDGKAITFLDTPGHAAFTEMRVRGAKVTDIVVIVIAADDGIKPQTIEAINHAKAADVQIIVAINKIDKPDANIERVKQELLMHDLVPEDLGGDIVIVPVSALKRLNLDKLLEAILIVAEMQDLKANVNAPAVGVVIESRVDRGMGPVSTVLVQRGTIKVGDIIVAGCSYGKIKLLNNDKSVQLLSAGPSEPVEVYGLNEAPKAGDQFNVVAFEKQARDIAEYRKRLYKNDKVSITKNENLDDLFLRASGTGKMKDLPIIIKGDVHGSLEAIATSLLKLPSDEVQVKILHQAVGGITESDVSLGIATGAIILGFNVRANSNAVILAESNKVDIRYFSIIYNLIDDMKAVMSGMLSPIIREEFIGSVSIRQVFNITKVGNIAGSYVTKGVIKRGAGVRLLRDDVVIYEGKLKTLKRFKDEVKEVREAYECGIAFENFEDMKVGDTVEVFEVVEEMRQLS